jgi:Ubiquitin-activating enzyme active site
LADTLAEKILTRKKIVRVRIITSNIEETGRVFDDIWKTNDIVLSTLSDQNITLALMEGSKKACKPLFVVTNIDQSPTVFSFTKLSIDVPRSKYINLSRDSSNEFVYDIDKEPLNYPTMQGLCIYWALAVFEKIFHLPYEDLNRCIADPLEFISNLEGTVIPENKLFDYAQLMEILKILFAPTYPMNYEDCIQLAFQYYQVVIA